jgi:hypothetical protein
MDNETPDQSYWDRADEIIHLANEQCNHEMNGKVSSSLLFATARFNAFIIASSAKNVEEMKNDKEEAIKYFTEQYKKMLIENIDDYIQNFEQNIEQVRS